jgi:gentisate 1,2-dioxygenase
MARHSHGNDGAEPAVLFSFQDVPLLKAVGLYREEEG